MGGGRPGRGGGRQGSTCVRSGGIDGLKSESVGDVEWERGTGRVELVGWEDCTRDLDYKGVGSRCNKGRCREGKETCGAF